MCDACQEQSPPTLAYPTGVRWRSPATWSALLLLFGTAVAARLRVSHLAQNMPLPPRLHLPIHVTFFALLTILVAAMAVAQVVLVGGVLLFGFWTEYYEHVKDGYPIEQPDVVADSAGVALGTLTELGLLALRQRDAVSSDTA